MFTIDWNLKRATARPRTMAAVLVGALLGIAPLCAAQQAIRNESVPLRNWSVKQAAGVPAVADAVTAATTGLIFVSTTPCRVMDTRTGSGMPKGFGAPSLAAMSARKVVVPSSTCGLPAAAAYSLYIASVTGPGVAVGWVDAWSGDIATWPGTAVLNAVQGGIVGAPATVAAGADGSIQLQSSQDTDIVIDVNGYWIQRSSLNFRGVWDASLSYRAGDVVTQTGSGMSFGSASSYVALAASAGIDPYSNAAASGAAWMLLAPSGGQGFPGLPGPAGPAGATGPQGPAGAPGAYMMIANIATTNVPTAVYIPLMSSGDPSTRVNTFQAQATVIPRACTVKRVYAAASSTASVSIGFHLWRSAGGIGVPTDTGVFVAAGQGSEASVSANLPLAAGDTVAYLVTPGWSNGKLVGTGALICQ